MKDFELKWKEAARHARQASPVDESVPFGFASRVLALARERSSPAPSPEAIWQRLTTRSLGLLGALLVICAVVELPHLRDRKPLDPGIENTVARLVWTL